MSKKLLLTIVATLLLANFLPSLTSATGLGSSNLTDQDQNLADDSLTAGSTNDFAIGGGTNDGGSESEPTPPADGDADNINTPADNTSVSQPIVFPEDQGTDLPQTNTSTTTSSDHTATTPVQTPIPSVPQKHPASTTTASSEPESKPENETSVVLPTVPNDNIAPDMLVDIPRTSLPDPHPANVNPLAVVLLFVAGATILSAAGVVVVLEKAAHRN